MHHTMSEDTTAMEAIGYIKSMVKTEIRDIMQKLKEQNQTLKHELAMAKCSKEKIKTRNKSMKNRLMMAKYNNKKNVMGSFVLARYMHGFSDHICNVTALNKSSRKEPNVEWHRNSNAE